MLVQLARGVLQPVLSLVTVSDDPSQLKSAVTLLLQLLRVCPTADLLTIDTGKHQGQLHDLSELQCFRCCQ